MSPGAAAITRKWASAQFLLRSGLMAKTTRYPLVPAETPVERYARWIPIVVPLLALLMLLLLAFAIGEVL
jgi:hypothetical protein